jgi:hypothetical protein
MPPDVRIASSVLIKYPGRFEQNVRTQELFQAIKQARMGAQLPGPLKKEMNSVKPGHTSGHGLAGFFNFGTVVGNFVLR